MGLPKYSARRDANEGEIVDALEGVGASVLRLSGSGIPDLAVYFRSTWFLMDAKTKRGKLTAVQTWADDISPDAVKIVRSVEQALTAIGAI